MHRDGLMAGNLHEIDGVQIRFIRHDYGLNRRSSPFTRFGWIMMLGFPLDYRSLGFIYQEVAAFGKLISWHNNPRARGFVLVKCLYNDVDTVLRSLFFRQGDRNGESWGWGVPVYVLNWDHPGNFLPPIDDLPPDGNPHPLPPAPPAAEGDQVENWANQFLQQQHGDPVWDAMVQQGQQGQNNAPHGQIQGLEAWPHNMVPDDNENEHNIAPAASSDES
jgi:hypothetical protein